VAAYACQVRVYFACVVSLPVRPLLLAFTRAVPSALNFCALCKLPGPCSYRALALAHTWPLLIPGPCSYLDLAHTWPLLMSGPCSYLALTHTSSCLATSSASQACLHSPSLYLIIYYLCVYLVGTQEGCCLKAGWADGT